MDKNVIYVEVRHFDFWWGVYGLAERTGWEDIIMYIKKGRGYKKKIASFCVCTKPYLENAINDLEDEPEESDKVAQMKEFIANDYIKYLYCMIN